jgi:hypothetical protein
MGVRKTESRIPANFKPDDLGQAVVAADGRCALVSFITSPLVIDRENTYVLFVTDPGLAVTAQSFEWTFTENKGLPNQQTTQHGEITYQPQEIGVLNVTVRIFSSTNIEQSNLAISQEIVFPNIELEALIAEASNEPGPGASNPDVLRELINEYSDYYQSIVLQTPEEGDGFRRFLFSMILDGTLTRTPAKRREHLDQLCESLNNQFSDFTILATEGVGICGIRLTLLAMILPIDSGNPASIFTWMELPEASVKRVFAEEQLRQKLAMLDENMRIDLLNIARFPKSNITECGRIIEALRNRYFNGTTFNDVLTGLSGIRANWITRHYLEGPLLRS